MRRLMAFICLLSFSQTYANICELPKDSLDKACLALKIKESMIKRKSDALDSLRELQEKLLAGKRLQEKILNNEELNENEKLIHQLSLLVEGSNNEKLASERLEKRIINTEDDMELINVEEQINSEIADINNSTTQQYYKSVASVGGLVLFSFVIQRMSRSTKGQALKRRLMAQIFPSENRIVKTGVNIGLLISLANGFFVLHKLYQNHKEEQTLSEMINLINQIKDQTNSILTLKEEIDEMDVCFWLQFDQLKEKGLARIDQNQLVCQ